MNKAEILIKMIDKAILNGCSQKGWNDMCFSEKMWSINKIIEDGIWFACVSTHEFAKAIWGDGKQKITDGSIWCDSNKIRNNLNELKDDISEMQMEELKKFGQTMVSSFCMYELNPTINTGNWEYHLQQIVILPDEEKWKYLEKFLDKT